MSKEQSFVSAVVYIQDDGPQTMSFLEQLGDKLEEHFVQYEIVAVNANCGSHSLDMLREWSSTCSKPLTVVNMSLKQTREQGMNAGLDVCIGDYVYEFDSVDLSYPLEMIWEAYQAALSGSDIVTVCPKKGRGWSNVFYAIYNAHSGAPYALRTDAFHLVSRRAINRARAVSNNMSYRKAVYASCGLKMSQLEFDGKISGRKHERFSLAADSLALYTDFGYKFSIGLTMCMFLIALAELIYTIVIFTTGRPVSGWTTTMLTITLGFAGLFSILALSLKHQSLILKLVSQKQRYLIESIERL